MSEVTEITGAELAPVTGLSIGSSIVELSAEIAAAYVGVHGVQSPSEIPELILNVGKALIAVRELENAEAVVEKNPGGDDTPFRATGVNPAVPVNESITPDYIVCLEDGKKLKMLKRHLRTAYNLTPDEYRARWGLPKDYPMVAPNYAKARSELAVKNDLGNSRRRAPAPVGNENTGNNTEAA